MPNKLMLKILLLLMRATFGSSLLVVLFCFVVSFGRRVGGATGLPLIIDDVVGNNSVFRELTAALVETAVEVEYIYYVTDTIGEQYVVVGVDQSGDIAGGTHSWGV